MSLKPLITTVNVWEYPNMALIVILILLLNGMASPQGGLENQLATNCDHKCRNKVLFSYCFHIFLLIVIITGSICGDKCAEDVCKCGDTEYEIFNLYCCISSNETCISQGN